MSENPFGVRKALPSDEGRLLAHLTLLHSENGLAPMNEEKVRDEIRRATETRGGIIGVIDGPNGIEGSVGLVLSQFWYSTSWHLEERWVYVHSDFRRTTHAKRLLMFAKWCKEEMTAAAGEEINLFIGILTKRQLEPKMRLYQRQFQQVGALFACGPVPEDTFNQRRVGNGKAA